MRYEATLNYTEPLLRQAVLRFWWRAVGVGFVVAMALVAISLGWFLARGDRSWFTGALGTVLLLGVGLLIALYASHYRHTLGTWRAMGGHSANLRVDDAGFTVASRLGSATLPWTAVTELWQFSEVWLLLYSKAQFSTLPLACLAPEMQSFILQRVRAAGAKVVD